MKTIDAVLQLVRMTLVGALCTAISILSTHRFGTWWAGSIGVLLALLLADVQKSREAVRTVWRRFVAEAKKLGVNVSWKYEWTRQLVIIVGMLLPALTTIVACGIIANMFWPWSGLLKGIFNYSYALLMLGWLGVLSFTANRKSYKAARGKALTLPISRSLRLFRFFRWLDEPAKNNPDEETTGVWRDKSGKLISLKGLVGAMLEFSRCFSLPLEAWAFTLLLIPLILDGILSLFLYITTTRAVALALGVIVGFTVDYIWCPRGISSTAIVTWFIGCSLLGGFCGAGFWEFRRWLQDSYKGEPVGA